MSDGFFAFMMLLLIAGSWLAFGWLAFVEGEQSGYQNGLTECCESRGGEYLAGKCVKKGSELR